ncbi:MAG: hypothetical protein KAS32_00225 [Candidatus Peribacteraceae bacterium]|nr:hypothetical protein [Candidatus Peribacteraceae bacterium]
MKHDEKKIARIIKKEFNPVRKGVFYDEISGAMREYAEHMVQQEKERIVGEIENFQEIRIEGIPVPDLRTQIINLVKTNHE